LAIEIAEKIDIRSLGAIPPIPDVIGGDKIVMTYTAFNVSFWD
jgi:hypothetical protein